MCMPSVMTVALYDYAGTYNPERILAFLKLYFARELLTFRSQLNTSGLVVVLVNVIVCIQTFLKEISVGKCIVKFIGVHSAVAVQRYGLSGLIYVEVPVSNPVRLGCVRIFKHKVLNIAFAAACE